MNEKEVKSANTLRSLRVFLIKRFIQAMIVIYISSQFTNLLYSEVFLKILNNVLQVGKIGYYGESLGALIELLFAAFVNLFARRMPMIQKMFSHFFGKVFGANIRVPEFVSRYGDNMVRLYFVTIILMIVIQLIITLLPYIWMGYWYCKGLTNKFRELRELDRERAKEEERKRNLLFSDIVHDIKTPITTIVGYSRALNDGIIQEEDKKQDYLNSIYAKSMRISDLITMLFEFVKLDSAGFTLHTEKLDIAELLRENVIALFPDFEDKGLEMDFDIPEEKCMASVDRLQMSRVITNLLTNAIRYSNEGNEVFVSMDRIKKDKDYYLISVADSGIPITEEFAKHIFEPFSRSDEARQTVSGGSGLGLSIAHKVAEMHGGELTLNLQYGNGYSKAFQILVPVLEE